MSFASFVKWTISGEDGDGIGNRYDHSDIFLVVAPPLAAIVRSRYRLYLPYANNRDLQIDTGRVNACGPAVRLRSPDRLQPALLVVRQRVQFLRWPQDDRRTGLRRG